MADDIFTKSQIEAVKEGYNHYYPYEAGLVPQPTPINDKWSDSNGIYRWTGVASYFRTLNQVTHITKRSDVLGAYAILEKMEQNAPKTVEFEGAEKPENPANMPTKELLDKTTVLSEEERRALINKSDKEVRDAIAQKIKIVEQQNMLTEQAEKTQALQKELDGKKVYIEIEKPSVSANDQVPLLKEEATISPEDFVTTTTEQFKIKLENQKLSPLEADLVAKQAALATYESLTGRTPLETAVILRTITSQDTLNKIITDPDMQMTLKVAAKARFNELTSQFDSYKQFIDAKRIDGAATLDEIKVNISMTPQAGYEEIDLNNEITSPHLESLRNQSDLLGSFKVPLDIGIDKIQERVLRSAGDALTRRIALLPKNSLVARTFNSDVVQFGLSQIGFVVPSTWVAVEGSWVGNLMVGSGFGPVAGILQGITGANFGVVQAISLTEAAELGGSLIGAETAVAIGGDLAGAAAATGAIGAAAGTAAAGAGVAAAGAGAEVAAATGVGAAIGNVPGAILAAVGSAIIAVLPEIKKFADEHRGEFFTAGVLALSVGGAIGSVALIAVGLPLSIVGGASMVAGGGGLGSIFGAIGGFIATMFAGFIDNVGKPILIALLTFPVLVALILFIINSGAYIVPPSIATLANQNAFIDVTKAANPPGPFQNTDLPVKAAYTITVSAKQQTLTGVTVQDECTVVSKAGQRSCGSSNYTVANGIINVGIPFVFTYDKTFDSTYKDSIVLNTVTVTASVANETATQTATGGTSITIGNPPTGCLVADKNQWPKGEYYNNIIYAMTKLTSDHPEYVSKVCSSYLKVLLLYEPNNRGNYWGWNDLEVTGVATIHFYALGVKSRDDALYTLSHELGHSLASGIRTAFIYAAYLATPGIRTEAPYCFYLDTINWNAGESMPEAIALYAIAPRAGCPSVQQKWPIHYQFLKKYVFN